MQSLSFAQNYTIEFDSITASHISMLPETKQKQFKKLLKHRKKRKISKRISDLLYDYAFIEEQYCFYNSKSTTWERYFVKNDSIPICAYKNGKAIDVKKEYNGFLIWYSKNVTFQFTLTPLINNYSSLKKTQKLNYGNNQIWSHGCVINQNDKNQFETGRKEELKTTFQIQTMIDNVNSKIIISVQSPPKNPKFKTISYNSVWDW